MYTVDWEPVALAMLAAIWSASQNRGAVTAAADAIDRQLAIDPFVHGVPVSEGLYAIEILPLRALFEVDTTAGEVTVVSVNRLP